MVEAPDPFTPAFCDLRDFPRMMIDIPRLFGSEFNALASRNPIAWMVGLKLWCRAWHQVPAASLPDDDGQLCHLAELGFDTKTFAKAKAVALRGWVLCSDGRLYHRTVAAGALEAWKKKVEQRWRTEVARIKKANQRNDATDPTPTLEQFTMSRGWSLGTEQPAPEDVPPLSLGTDEDVPRDKEPCPSGRPQGNALLGTGKGTGTVIRKKEDGGPRSRSRPKRPLPPDWRLSEIEVAYAAKAGLKPDEITRSAERFANHAWQQDRRCVDWTAAWRNWVAKDVQAKPAPRKAEVIW